MQVQLKQDVPALPFPPEFNVWDALTLRDNHIRIIQSHQSGLVHIYGNLLKNNQFYSHPKRERELKQIVQQAKELIYKAHIPREYKERLYTQNKALAQKVRESWAEKDVAIKEGIN